MAGEAPLALLCAGAARGLVTALAPAFTRETGIAVDATFGAVGALLEKLDAGARCDAIVLTEALIARLEREGRVVAGSAAPLGRVPAAVAVRSGTPAPDVHDAVALRATLLRATRLFFPDPQRATAGIHFAGVLQRLGIDREVAARCATFPNGAAAMAALAQPGESGDVGCTQSTEILATEGVTLVGPLPPPLDLATMYSIAVGANAAVPAPARRLSEMLSGPQARELRAACGFAPGD